MHMCSCTYAHPAEPLARANAQLRTEAQRKAWRPTVIRERYSRAPTNHRKAFSLSPGAARVPCLPRGMAG
eukprot:8664572-Alexandrium_andersonii.AAC.1